MKKEITIILALLFSLSTKSQNIIFPINKTGEVEYMEIVKCDLDSSMLFANAQEWVAKTFGDYKSVIQFEDKENKKLILKGVHSFGKIQDAVLLGIDISIWQNIHFTMAIECKTNRYRYSIVDITNEKVFAGGEKKIGNLLDLYNIKFYEDRILECQEELNQLNTIDLSKLKKKEKKKIEEKKNTMLVRINSAKSNIKSDEEEAVKIHKAIESIAESLKEFICMDNSF